jgi:hypothetical protein
LIEALWAGLLLISFFFLCISASFKITAELKNEEIELQKTISMLAHQEQ